jgi:hypothetical protein
MLMLSPSILPHSKVEVLGYIPLPQDSLAGADEIKVVAVDVATLELLRPYLPATATVQDPTGASAPPRPTQHAPGRIRAPLLEPTRKDVSLDTFFERGKGALVGGILIDGGLKGAYWANTVQPDQAIAVLQQSTNFAPASAALLKSALGFLKTDLGHAVTFALVFAGAGYVLVKVTRPDLLSTIKTGVQFLLSLFALGIFVYLILKSLGIVV